MQGESLKDKQTIYEAGATLLNEPVRFKIKWWFGIKLPFGIRPLKPGTIVKISQQETRLKPVDESGQMIHELLLAGNNYKVFARIIAVAVLNHPVKIRLFSRWLSYFLLWNIPSTQDMLTLISLVYKQMGAEHFFFIMQLTQGMNFLKKRMKTENTGAEKPSGEQLP